MEQKEPGYYLKPLLLLTVTLGAVFLVELLVMFLLQLMPWLSTIQVAFLDAFLLTVFLVPFLYFFLFRPIHGQIEIRRQRKQERDALKELNHLKSEIITTAAHELRTPLAAIMGFTELMVDRDLLGTVSDKQRDEFLTLIYENSERLSRIVDDLLDVSRIEAGQAIALDRRPHSLRELLEKVVSRFRLSSGHTFELEISSGVPETLVFDELRIDQVIQNLLSNAVKYSPKGSLVRVVAEEDGGGCRMTVIDQGIGMTEEQQARIFEKFYRANASDTAVKGLGLGMSIVKQIVIDHGGGITVESRLGAGTRVCFSLPAPDEKP